MKISVLVLILFLASCTNQTSTAQAQNLQWYSTCGDPVCRAGGHRTQPNVPPCTLLQALGSACNSAGQRCDPINDCNSLYVCSDQDPTKQTGGCPISRRAYKSEIKYLSQEDLHRQHDAMMRLHLATYKYAWDSKETPLHLGFIIDDIKDSSMIKQIASDGNHVDLYAYTSMLAAALQVQAEEIATLQNEIVHCHR